MFTYLHVVIRSLRVSGFNVNGSLPICVLRAPVDCWTIIIYHFWKFTLFRVSYYSARLLCCSDNSVYAYVHAQDEVQHKTVSMITILFEIPRRFTRCFVGSNRDGALPIGFCVEISHFTNTPFIHFVVMLWFMKDFSCFKFV